MENENKLPESPEIEPVEDVSQPGTESGLDSAPASDGTPVSEAEAVPSTGASPIEETQAPVQGETAGVSVEAAQPARRSWLFRLLHFLFSPDTRLGRFMRPFLRWTAAVVGLFALGLLVGYLLLYQPTSQQLAAARDQIGQLNDEIGRLQVDSTSLQNSLGTANQRLQTAQDDVKKAQARNNLLVVIYDIANARTSLAQKDGAKVMSSLLQAQADMQVLQPYLVANKKELADELNSRLETVRSVLVRDSQMAQSDLDNLYTALLAANDLLFGSK